MTEYQGSFLGRISIRRNQVMSMDHEQELEDLELFQKHVADRFADLLSPPLAALSESETPNSASSMAAAMPIDQFLSISWLRKMLDVYLCCEAEFKAVLLMGRDPSQISKPPLDRLILEMLDRAVKALDICNAITNGVESVRHCQRLAEIAVASLKQKPLGEGQVRRAKKALHSLMNALVDDKDGNNSKSTERTWSFGRRGGGGANKDRANAPFRTLPTTVAKNWSASKQLQAMTTNLVAPRGADSTGLALPLYMMSSVLVLVSWVLVVAIPCQERTGLATHFPVPKQFHWAASLIGLQEKIGEEWKKKEKKGTAGLMEEMQMLEKLGQTLIDFIDSFQFPVEDGRIEEVEAQVAEMAEICRRMEEGLVPLQMQVREVFHRIVRGRAEILDALDHAAKVSAPVM
ncbi:hypothetical protein ACFE04_012447 [Oxalis oulophora]